jgi:hypothetical protein
LENNGVGNIGLATDLPQRNKINGIIYSNYDFLRGLSPGDIIRSAEKSVKTIVRNSFAKIGLVIAPSKVTDFSVTFRDKPEKVSINLTVRRDTPLLIRGVPLDRQDVGLRAEPAG